MASLEGSTEREAAQKSPAEYLEEFMSSPWFSIAVSGNALLQDATLRNDTKSVEILLKAGVDANARYSFSRTALHTAAAKGNNDVAEMLIKFGANVESKDANGVTPLHEAADKLNTKVVKLLLEAKADVNARDKSGNSPLLKLVGLPTEYHAWRNQILDLLLQYGVDVREAILPKKNDYYILSMLRDTKAKIDLAQAKIGCLPLRLDTLDQCRDIINALIKYVDIKEDTPLNESDSNKDSDTLPKVGADAKGEAVFDNFVAFAVRKDESRGSSDNVLLKFGTNLATKNFKSIFSRLHVVTMQDQVQIVEDFLKSTNNSNQDNADSVADPEIPYQLQIFFQNTEDLAATHSTEQIVEELLKAGADTNVQPRFGNTALHLSVQAENCEIANRLIQNGANVDLKNFNNETPLHIAVDREQAHMVENFLKNGADANSKNWKGRAPLHLAAEYESSEIFDTLIKHGAIVNVKDIEEETPLHVAAWHNRAHIVEELLKHGADANAKNKEEVTPLHIAADYRCTDVVKSLLTSGADANIKNQNGDTPLHLSSNREIFNLLIQFGAKVDQKNNNGQTALQIQCSNGEEDARNVEILLKAGANPNVQDQEGNTPLHFCVTNSGTECVELLLKYGATIGFKNHKGQNALHSASFKTGEPEIAVLLIEKGTDLDSLCNESKKAMDYAAKMYEESASLEEAGDIIPFFDSFYRRQKAKDIYRVFQFHEIVMKFVNGESEVNEEYGELYEELQKLLTTKIGVSYITYHDFLKAHGQNLLNMLKNENIRVVLDTESYKQEFDIFSTVIGNHYHKGLIRKRLIDQLRPNTFDIFPTLPTECAELIFNYLPNDDLFNFVAALGSI